jgi:hypothetical protein
VKINTRLPDWEARLDDVLRDWRFRRFVWGLADCVHFAQDAGRALTGRDIFGALPAYDTEAAARRALLGAGHRSLDSFACAHLPGIARAQAGRGDIVLAPAAAQVPGALGVCVGPTASFVAREGLEFLPMGMVHLAWGVAR